MSGKLGRPTVSKPLAGSVYYLDIRPSRKREFIKLNLLKLGAQLEEFLSKDVKYLVTDRLDGGTTSNNGQTSKAHLDADPWLPETPLSGVPSPTCTLTKVFPLDQDIQFPDSPVTDSYKTPVSIHTAVQSRGQALLERAVKHKVQKQGSADVLEVSRQFGIKILPLQTFLPSINNLLEPFKQKQSCPSTKKPGEHPFKLVTLSEPFIKVQDMNEKHQPFYKQLESLKLHWEEVANAPKGQENNSRLLKENKLLSPKTPSAPSQRMGSSIGLAAKVRDMYKVKKLQSYSLSKPKAKMGYCEICGTSYTNLSKHVLNRTHSLYMCSEANFDHLKGMVQTLPPVNSLKAKRKKRPLTDANGVLRTTQVHKKQKPSVSQKSSKAVSKSDEVNEKESVPSPKLLDIKISTFKVEATVVEDRLFTDGESEDDKGLEDDTLEIVDASCSTAGCSMTGCPGKVLCQTTSLCRDCSSEELPLVTRHLGKVVISICSSPNCPLRPPNAHQSSSSTVPFPQPGAGGPLNLSVRQSSEGNKVKSSESVPTAKVNAAGQCSHIFFSENARVSSLEPKDTGIARVSKERADVDLSFCNLNFVPRDEGFQITSKSKLKPLVTRKNDMSPTTLALVASSSSNNELCANDNGCSVKVSNVSSVRKVLFMSDESSPTKNVKSNNDSYSSDTEPGSSCSDFEELPEQVDMASS